MKKKTISMLIALVLVLCCAVGGTLAWLTSQTGTVTNTFTSSNIDITLDETTGDTYKMVPGSNITKDPEVTVEAGSEACWLFVKVLESDNFDDFMTYTMDSNWTAVPGHDGYYYKQVASLVDASDDLVIPVLKDDKISVLGTVTKDQMDDIEDGTIDAPTLSFVAAAIQSENIADLATAWDNLPAEFK